MNFCLLWQVLLIFSSFWRPHRAELRGTCSQCLANGIACLDEHTFTMCYQGTMTNQNIKCSTGSVCTDQKIICGSELEGNIPICAEDNCDNCAPTQGRFACVNQTSYGFCFGAMTHNVNTVRHCPDGMVCTLQGTRVCGLAENTSPACVPQIDDGDDIEPTEDTTLTTEDIEATTEGTGAITEDIAATTEGTMTTIDGTTAGSEGSTTEDTISTTENIGATTKATITTTDGIIVTTEGLTSSTEDIEVTTKDTTATTDGTIATAEGLTSTTEDTTLTTENITPTTGGSAATTQGTSTMTDGTTATTEVITPNTEGTAQNTEGTARTTEGTTATTKGTTTDEGASTSETMTTTEETSTVEVGPIDAFFFCGNKKRQGFFKDESDKSCKQYIYCYILSGQYLGYVYKCEGYFNGITNSCQKGFPLDCMSVL